MRTIDYFDGKTKTDHGVLCKCGKIIFLNKEEVTPPVTKIICPKCGFEIKYFCTNVDVNEF